MASDLLLAASSLISWISLSFSLSSFLAFSSWASSLRAFAPAELASLVVEVVEVAEAGGFVVVVLAEVGAAVVACVELACVESGAGSALLTLVRVGAAGMAPELGSGAVTEYVTPVFWRGWVGTDRVTGGPGGRVRDPLEITPGAALRTYGWGVVWALILSTCVATEVAVVGLSLEGSDGGGFVDCGVWGTAIMGGGPTTGGMEC